MFFKFDMLFFQSYIVIINFKYQTYVKRIILQTWVQKKVKVFEPKKVKAEWRSLPIPCRDDDADVWR